MFSSESSVQLGDKKWTLSGTDGAYLTYDGSKGHQFGSENNPFYEMNLTVTTNFTNISCSYVNFCCYHVFF